MNSLESVRTLLIDYLEEALACRSEMENVSLISGKKDFQNKVYNAFFDLISDPTRTPESIVQLLDTYTSGLGGFSTNICLQTLVAFACLEALARRQPEVLNGPWETLLWRIVKYSSFANATTGEEEIIEMYTFKKANIATLKLITEFGSPELCPNPCLRLELFRFMRTFNCNDMDYDSVSYRDKVINTLFEICDNYTSLTVDKVPNFSPIDLYFFMEDNYINMGYIMNDNDLDIQKYKIITSVLKITKKLALLEKERHQNLYNQAIVHGIWFYRKQLSACLSFCGLLPLSPYHGFYDPVGAFDHDDCLLYLVQAVDNNYVLLNHVIETLDTITQLSLCYPYKSDLRDLVMHNKDKLLHRFFKGHIKQLPTFQCMQEIYGGIAPAKENQLRYFQNNFLLDQYKYIDSDNASECSNE